MVDGNIVALGRAEQAAAISRSDLIHTSMACDMVEETKIV
jgi:hypothetical protein